MDAQSWFRGMPVLVLATAMLALWPGGSPPARAAEVTPSAPNTYFVSDTNYGRGPDSIGHRTDIPNWMDWFRSPATPGSDLTLANAKYTYNQLLTYFASRPDRLFVVVTAPPKSESQYAANARAFNNWLVNNWLAENTYQLKNVAVFDSYNVLTGPDNHHRVYFSFEQHTYTPGMNSAY